LQSPNQDAADGTAPRSRFHLVLKSYSRIGVALIAKPDFCESIASGACRNLTLDSKDLAAVGVLGANRKPRRGRGHCE
jgi:hypothetical protein